MSTSKFATWVGLMLVALGGGAAGLAHSLPAATILVTLGTVFTALGDSLLAKSAAAVSALWATCMLQACAVPPNVVQGGVAGVELAICVMNTFSKDKAAGKSDGDAIADCIVQCGTDAATISRIIDAQKAATYRESLGPSK